MYVYIYIHIIYIHIYIYVYIYICIYIYICVYIYAPFLISWCPSCHSKSFSPSVSTRSVHWFTCCRLLPITAGIVRAELCRRPHTHELLWTCNQPLRRVRYQLDGLITQRAARIFEQAKKKQCETGEDQIGNRMESLNIHWMVWMIG